MTVQTAEAGSPRAEAALATAAAYQAEQEAETRRLVAAILVLWASLDAKKAFDSWTIGGIGTRIFVLVSSLMELVAADAGGYVRQVLDDQGIDYTGPAINPIAFAGAASDGRDLESLLAGALAKLREQQRQGRSDAQAKMAGRNFLELVANTQVRDAARAAESAALVVAGGRDRASGRKVAVGYVRMLTPPSCGRCAVLAGKFYRWNDGFQRHPNCFPAGTVVSGPRMEAATRRWYEGELVTIRTASGQELSVTGNHPVLTRAGWLPARLLVPGVEVFRSTGIKSALGQVPHDQQVPALVEDVFRSLGVMGDTAQVPSAAEDFHGDGSAGQVDVVAADRHLRLEEQPEVVGQAGETPLGLGVESTLLHAGAGGPGQRGFAAGSPAQRLMTGSGLGQALSGGHPAGSQTSSRRLIADLNALLQEASANGIPADLVAKTQRVLALASRILRRQSSVVEQQVPARWDAPAGAFTMKTRAGYASRGQDLIERLTGQVTADRVVEKVSRQWSGHVYNLTSSEGWMSAGNLITSNCDCRHIPTTVAGSNEILTNPYAYFQSLSEEDQDRYFGGPQAKAIREGADINQVVNSARTKGSVFVADDGRRYTNEGTTKRGFARNVAGNVLRPTVWQIYRDADGDRTEAIRLLERFGYILPGGSAAA